jgi:hypothetical protein
VIRDPDADAELREIERDLLDAAAAGTLDPARRALVVEHLTHAPHNRAAVVVAQALAEHQVRGSGSVASTSTAASTPTSTAASTSTSTAASTSRPSGPSSAASAWRWTVAWPAAAALLLAAGLGIFILRTSRDEPGANAAPTSASASPSSASAPLTPSTPSRAANTSPGSTDPAARPPSESTPPGESTRPGDATAELPRDPSRVVALFLPAGTLRGARPSVRLPREAETLRLEIELDAEPAPSEVTVAIRPVSDAGGDAGGSEVSPPPATSASSPSPASAPAHAVVWTSRVRVRVEDGQAIAIAFVPAPLIPAGVVEATVTWPRRVSASPGEAGVPPPQPLSRVVSFLVRRD